MAEQEIPIKTVHLFPVLDQMLIELLRSLSADDWNKPTVARLWAVKDIAAHLLDTNVRSIASSQNFAGPPPSNPINSYADLVHFLNDLNATWVQAMKRTSPQLLIELLEITGKQHAEIMASLNPFAQAQYPVAWAGEEQSLNWFHVAREYTEKFHHQQQIREATGKQGIMTAELFYPCADTFMQGLPHAYRPFEADTGTLIKIHISGEAGGTWFLNKTINKWMLSKAANSAIDVTVTLSPDTAWKVFTKAITPQLAIKISNIEGDFNLGENLFNLVAVMA